LNALAPTGTEQPFKLTQIVVLAVFILLTLIGMWRFRPRP
jgi:Tfp pilus assembly protein PilX